MNISRKKELQICLFLDKNNRIITHILGAIGGLITLFIHEEWIFPSVFGFKLGVFSLALNKIPVKLIFIFSNFVVSEYLHHKDLDEREKSILETIRELEELEELEKNSNEV